MSPRRAGSSSTRRSSSRPAPTSSSTVDEAISPVTVATGLFPRYAREGNAPVVEALHRISRVYAVLGASVPVFGIATGAQLGVLGDPWLVVSLALTAGAAALLALVVLPGQARVVAGLRAAEPVRVAPRPAAASGSSP